ncbi:MAG: hypothetical protein PV358_01490 [Acidimicrobiales bacterium]|nr:hypothetical protein [Acidimicrobiales bacterium]
MNDGDAARLVEEFEHLRLPKPQWTHEAHLVVCRATLQRLGPAGALAHLRRAIRAYNESTGGANTDTDGYHETLTAYYVGAVDAVSALALDELVAHPACARTAPLTHWSRDRLFSVAARRSWVPPDREPLAWWSPALAGPAGGQR